MTTGDYRVLPLLDNPEDDPGLGFKQYAVTLGQMVMSAGNGPMTVGVFGGYGTGKTTLMHAIKRFIDDDCKKTDSIHQSNVPSYFTVWFEAWRHEHERHLLLPFLSSLYNDENIKNNAPSLRGRIGAATSGFLKGLSFKAKLGVAEVGWDADKALKGEANKSGTAAYKAVGEYADLVAELQKFAQGGDMQDVRVVIFIDDLDRCLPNKAMGLLESVKSLMGIPGFLFVIGLDSRAVENYVFRKYRDLPVSADEYLQKMFQVPFVLPRLNTGEVADEVLNIIRRLKQRIPDDAANHKELAAWADHLGGEMSTLKGYLPGNIRQIKRIINWHQVVLISGVVNNQKDSVFLLRMLILKNNWPFAFRALTRIGLEVGEIIANTYEKGKLTEQRLSDIAEHVEDELLDDRLVSFMVNEVVKKCPNRNYLDSMAMILGDWGGK